jgi:TLD
VGLGGWDPPADEGIPGLEGHSHDAEAGLGAFVFVVGESCLRVESFYAMARDSQDSQSSSSNRSASPSFPRSTTSTQGIRGHIASITSSLQRRLSFTPSYPSSPSSAIDVPLPQLHDSEPPLSPIQIHGYIPSTTERLLSPPMAEDIRPMMPMKHQVHSDWELVYSLDQHGTSLATLYARCKALSTPQAGFVVVVKDRAGNTFGAYLSDYPRIHAHYYGTGECFLYKFTRVGLRGYSTHEDGERPGSVDSTESYQLRGFSYTGLNDYMILCTPQFLSVGGGYVRARYFC